jgi:hypothetical protein
MSALDTLIWKLTHEDHLAAVEKNRSRLESAANWTKESSDDDEMWLCLNVILLYVKKHRQCPPSLASVNDFIDAEDSNEAWELTRSRELIRGALVSLKNRMADRKTSSKDIAVLIDSVYRDARREFHRLLGLRYADIVSNGPSPAGKDHVPSGPDDAMAFIRQMWGFDLIEEGGIGGSYDANRRVVAKYLADIYNAKGSDRILLGFPELDNVVMVGGMYNKLIGVMGFSNEGKSLFVRTLAFNMAMQGKKVLYVTLEEDAKSCLAKFLFLLGDHFEMEANSGCPVHENCTFTMPSFADYKFQRLQEQDIDHTDHVNDSPEAALLPTVYDRKTLNDWDSIEAKALNEKFDVIFVDYVGILNIPNVKPKDLDFAIDGMYKHIHEFCLKHDKVVVTPLQVNREGKKQAEKKDKTDEIYNLTHVSKHSSAYQEADIILAVYSDPEMKQRGEMKIETKKLRDDDYPMPFFASVAPNTKHVTQLPGPEAKCGKAYLDSIPDPKMPDFKLGDENLAERNDWIDEALM